MFGNQLDSRTRRVGWNVGVSALCKALVALVTFVQVPLVLGCLGEYSNGVWLTISSLLVWIEVMDIGLGNGLRNKLAEAVAHGRMDDARRVVSSAFAMLFVIMLPTALVLDVAIMSADVYAFLNVDPNEVTGLNEMIAIGVTLVCCAFVLKFIGNVYMGLQLPSVSNVLQALGMSLALLLTWMLALTDNGTLENIVIVNTGAPLVVYMIAYPVTFCRYKALRPKLNMMEWATGKGLLNLGSKFFFVQVGGLFLFATCNFFISHYYSPAVVTPFQIAHRYMTLLVTIFTIVAMPMWNATTDAYHRGDWQWIRDADRKMGRVCWMFVAIAVMLVAFAPVFYNLWIGDKSSVPMEYNVLLGMYAMVVIVSTRYSYFLNGIGALRLQVVMTAVDAALFVAGVMLITSITNDLRYFIALMTLTQLPGLLVNMIQFNRILDNKATGIWRII